MKQSKTSNASASTVATENKPADFAAVESGQSPDAIAARAAAHAEKQAAAAAYVEQGIALQRQLDDYWAKASAFAAEVAAVRCGKSVNKAGRPGTDSWRAITGITMSANIGLQRLFDLHNIATNAVGSGDKDGAGAMSGEDAAAARAKFRKSKGTKGHDGSGAMRSKIAVPMALDAVI
jgi:hypothetical protein